MFERHLVERDRQAHGGDAAEQRVEHDLQFRAGQLLPDALVTSVAEAELLAGVAGEVELVGFGDRRTASQFAGARSMMMPSPARMVSPAISMSSMATRRWPFWMIDR